MNGRLVEVTLLGCGCGSLLVVLIGALALYGLTALGAVVKTAATLRCLLGLC